VRFSGMPGIIGNAGCDLPSAWTWDFVRHEAPVRREALRTEGGVRPPRRVVAAAWWELSAA
jgi:hypothetical protein